MFSARDAIEPKSCGEQDSPGCKRQDHDQRERRAQGQPAEHAFILTILVLVIRDLGDVGRLEGTLRTKAADAHRAMRAVRPA